MHERAGLRTSSRAAAAHLKESQEIHRTGLEQLQASDPELFKAVWRVMWEKGLEDIETTLEEWKVNATRRVRHLSKVRAEMQRAGSI